MSLPREIADLHAADKLGPAFLGLQLLQLLTIIDHQGREMLDQEGIGLPSRSGSTLVVLLRQGPASVTELARVLGLSHQLVRYRINDLAAHDLIEEIPAPHDGRKTCIGLSREGRAMGRRVERIVKVTERAFATVFDEIGVDLFAELIKAKAALGERSLSARAIAAPAAEKGKAPANG